MLYCVYLRNGKYNCCIATVRASSQKQMFSVGNTLKSQIELAHGSSLKRRMGVEASLVDNVWHN